MKKLLAILLVAAMLLTFAACDKKVDGPGTAGGNGSAETTAPAEDNTLSHSFDQFGKGKITIVGTELDTDEDEETFLRIYYDYTNTADTAAGHYGDTMNFTLTQNGEELEDVSFWYPDDEGCIADDLYNDLSVQPGVTVRRTALYYCDPEGGIIDVSCYLMVGSWAYNSDDVQKFTFQVDPADLMGAPAPYEVQTLGKTGYTDGLPTSGEVDAAVPYTISVDGFEVTTCDDLPAIRVKLTYTNLDDEAWPPSVPVDIEAYQDGISLAWGDSWYLEETTAEDEAFGEDVEPGATVQCNAIFMLRGDSPVDVVVEAPNVEMRIGATYDIK